MVSCTCTASGRSLNQGIEQERLDGVPGAKVEVTALRQRDAAGPPHLELLRYLPPSAGRHMSVPPRISVAGVSYRKLIR